jgi:5,10-methylenetetrahydromethanopterin reductase
MTADIAIGLGVYQQQPVAGMLQLAQRAEALGFQHIGFNDNQCGSRELLMTLGAVAASTSRIRIGSAVANPVTRHITVLAGGWYSLQELAGERVFAGLGRGELSVALIGAGRATVERLGWTIQALRALWAGETVEVEGHPTKLAYAGDQPRRIPVYVAGSAPKMLELAGRLADGVMISAGAHPPYIRAAAEHAWRAAEVAGRDPAGLRTIARMACVVSDDPAAWRAAATHVAMTAVRPAVFSLDEEDRLAADRIREVYSAAGHLELETSYTRYVTDTLLRKLALIGSASEVRTRVAELAGMGIDQLDLIPAGPDQMRAIEGIAEALL